MKRPLIAKNLSCITWALLVSAAVTVIAPRLFFQKRFIICLAKYIQNCLEVTPTK
ncbi:MAG: hypothetical protein ACI9ES_001781 [Oceanospirillaceae bacterium]|jgi:hypothetical protein